MAQPKNHHWWPVALQSYWADRNGDVSAVRSDGSIQKKRFKNRKIGLKRHGHTMLRDGGAWETNFEHEFQIDDKIHEIIAGLKKRKPVGYRVSDWPSLIRRALSNNVQIDDLCNFYTFEESFHRELLLLIHSLVIRSPSNRWIFENFPAQFRAPASEDVGKANMYQQYRLAQKMCADAHLPIDAFVLMHSPFRPFICGDGYLSSLVSSLSANRISGKALLPLTPHLCIYFCTKNMGRPRGNVASLVAPDWMVEDANEITQIYSRDFLFFRGRPPQLAECFKQSSFLQLEYHSSRLTDTLDELVGNQPSGLLSF